MTTWLSNAWESRLVSGLELDSVSDAATEGWSSKNCPAAHPRTHPLRVFAPVFLLYLEAAVGGQQLPQLSPTHLPAQTPGLLFFPAQHTSSTCLKTRNRFPGSTPWSSSSLQPQLSNSSVSTGYGDTSFSSCRKLCGCQATSCWAPDLFPGPESEPQPYVSRVQGTPALVRYRRRRLGERK